MSNLSEEFNIEEVRVEIESFKDILSKVKEIPNPSAVVTAAIDKATTFIDIVHSELVNGEVSPRYLEVAAQLINTVIQASGFIGASAQADFDNNLKTIASKQKDREIDIKQDELKIKELYYSSKKQIGNETETNNNIVITDYNSILKFLNKKSLGNTSKSYVEIDEKVNQG